MTTRKLDSLILGVLLSFTFVVSSISTAATCRAVAQKKLASFKTRQKNVVDKYNELAVKRSLKRLTADQADTTLSVEQRKLAKMMANEVSALIENQYQNFDFVMQTYTEYLQVRFFNQGRQITNARQTMAKMKKLAEMDEEIFGEYRYPQIPTRYIRIPGLVSYEQLSELRAYAKSPLGTIEKNETVDAVPDQDLSYFQRHDRAHFDSWVSSLENVQRFYGVDMKQLFEQTSAYFEKIREDLDQKSKPERKVRNVFFFMYFYVSHEKNIDVISSSRWLLHWNNSLYTEKRTEKELLELPLEQLFPENSNKMNMAGLNELAGYYGWPYGEITYAEYIAALKLIRGLN